MCHLYSSTLLACLFVPSAQYADHKDWLEWGQQQTVGQTAEKVRQSREGKTRKGTVNKEDTQSRDSGQMSGTT